MFIILSAYRWILFLYAIKINHYNRHFSNEPSSIHYMYLTAVQRYDRIEKFFFRSVNMRFAYSVFKRLIFSCPDKKTLGRQRPVLDACNRIRHDVYTAVMLDLGMYLQSTNRLSYYFILTLYICFQFLQSEYTFIIASL